MKNMKEKSGPRSGAKSGAGSKTDSRDNAQNSAKDKPVYKSTENRGGSRELAGIRTKAPAAGKESDHRVQRVEREIREVVGSYLISGFRGSLPGLVSLTRVICAKDLRAAKIYVTMLSFGSAKKLSATELVKFNKREEVDRKKAVEVLQAHAFEVQNEINRCMKMKYCPKVAFLYDESYENVMKVEKILRDIGQEKAKTQTDLTKALASESDDSGNSEIETEN